MTIATTIQNLAARVASAWSSGYDATVNKPRRKATRISLRSEDQHLAGTDRARLLTAGRDIERNFSVAAWMVRRHLDYTTSFQFQSKTGDHALDDEIEAILRWYSRPENCDVMGRHDLSTIARMAEERALVDGDVFLLKLNTGHLQPIEGDRITDRDITIPRSIRATGQRIINGVQVAANGRPIGYIVARRTEHGQLAYERFLRRQFVLHHGYFTRFDQLRGISPLASAINSLRDLYESCDYALAKMKLSQLLGLVFYREDMGEYDPENAEPYEVNFEDGLATLHLDPGDKADLLESRNPSQEFQGFAATTIRLALAALDIPLCHWDESQVNYAGGRRADEAYELSAGQKRARVRRMLDNIVRWRLALMIQDGQLTLPRGMTLGDLKWEFVNTSTRWYLDPLKEISAEIAAVEAGFLSVPEVAKMRGRDAYAIAQEQAEYLAHRRSLGLPDDSRSVLERARIGVNDE